VIAAGDHDVDDREVPGFPPVVAGHVAEVTSGHLDLLAQEAVVGDRQLVDLLVAQHAAEVDVAVAVEPLPFLVRHAVLVAVDSLAQLHSLHLLASRPIMAPRWRVGSHLVAGGW
jgi:hypothetical protein